MLLVTPIAMVLFALSAPAPARTAETVVMVPFQNLSGAGHAPEAVSAELARRMESRGYRVVRGEAVDEFLAAEKIRYLDSLQASSREKLLQRFEASAAVLGTIFDFAESYNPVVAVSARMVSADGKVAWSAVAGLSADDTKKVFGFGRLGSLDTLAAKTVAILTRDLPKPGSASKLESARSKPLDLSSPRTFRSAALAGGGNLVCILPLENRSAARVAPRVLGELLAQRLAASEGFRVVEASEFRNAMAATGVYGIRTGDPEELKKLGTKVGTNLFLKGTIFAYKDVLPGSGVTTPEIDLQLTLVDVAAGKVLWTSSLARKGIDYSGLLQLGAISNAVTLADQVVAEMIRAGENARPVGSPGAARAAAPSPAPTRGRPS
jgi:hypothetical protein